MMEVYMGKTKIKPKSELALARAKRIRTLRDALRYSREDFAQKYGEKHGFTYSALQSWEAVRWHGLTENGARKLVACFKEEGLDITIEWLMYGTGTDPYEQAVRKGLASILPESAFNRAEEPAASYSAEKPGIAQELRVFHQHNPGSVDAMVTDDGMSPWLMPGDHVAGQRYFDDDIEQGINQPCIIQTLAGNTLIRLLKPGKDISYYTLVCTNLNTTVNEAIIENVKLFSAAPITWIRKKTGE